MKFNGPKIMFFLSVVGLAFAWGLATGKYRVFPHAIVDYAVDSVRLVIDDFGMRTGARPVEHLAIPRHEGSGVTRNDPERSSPGLTLVSSFFDDEVAIRLMDADGTVVNQWPLRYHEVWGGEDDFMPASARPVTDWHMETAGQVVLPDGSLIVVLKGLVRFDRCGNITWKLPHKFHHSLALTPPETLWATGTRYADDESLHPPLPAPYQMDTLVNVSLDGEILQEIVVLDLLWNDEWMAKLFANNRPFDPNPVGDVVHLNEVEEIPPEYLDAFPMFSAGDLLVSLRQPNLVMVVEPSTGRIKWHRTGPWIQQHDADWQPDGTITVFDNRFDGSPYGSILGGSNIISVDPRTDEVRYLYGDREGQHFYTRQQGNHQVLPNGNILINETNAGRVFEVTPSGDIVWEYVNRYSEERVVKTRDAIRYPHDYFEVSDWSCDRS